MRRALPFNLASMVALAALFAVSACGKSASQSPLAPSTSSPAASPSSTGATISGQVTTGGAASSRFADVAAGMSVTIVGTSITAAVDNFGRFRLDNAPAGDLQLQFAGGGVSAVVSLGQVAERERLEVEIEIHGNSGSVVATQHISSDDRAEVEGRIASLDASARSMQVGTASIQVQANASIRSGAVTLQFTDLQVQQRVHVRGTLQGSVVSAEEVEVEDAGHSEPEPGDDQGETEFTGSIASLGGSCPSRTMSVAGKSVRTNGATSFLKAACGDLRTGMIVEVKGNLQPDGSVLAVRIQLEDDPAEVEPEVEFKGSVASMGGSCPSLSLSVAGRSVKTNGSTEFRDSSCSDVQPGVTVEVKGKAENDGSVTASRLKVDR